LKIKIFYDNIKFRLKETGSIKKFLEKVIREEKKIPGDLNFILTGDKQIREINREYLGHDYFTDVISFGAGEGREVSGEIYISIDTVKNNSKVYGTKLREEIVRVMLHGVLHICGYEDHETKDRDRMFKRQESMLNGYLAKS
jgi:probable rRNA maturation factor